MGSRRYARSEEASGDEAAEKAADDKNEQAYRALLGRFCVAELVPQGISYGSEPSHDPKAESIRGAKRSGDSWLVETEMRSCDGFATRYDYAVTSSSGAWKLEQVYYVDEDGGYPAL